MPQKSSGYFTISTAFKPLDEILAYPPKFFVRHPTLSNFTDLIEITQETWIPFERSLFNSLALAFLGTVIYIVVASMAAFPLAKSRERFIAVYYQIVAAGGAAQGCAFANLCHALPPYNHLDSSLLMSVHMISISPNSTTATAQA